VASMGTSFRAVRARRNVAGGRISGEEGCPFANGANEEREALEGRRPSREPVPVASTVVHRWDTVNHPDR
jgi:hypothetical protein